MQVDQQDPEYQEWRTVTNARFVMVSRDPMNKGSAFVNPLIPVTDEEKAIFDKGEGNQLKKGKNHSDLLSQVVFVGTVSKNRRMQMQSKSLIRQAPNEEERLVIHEQFLRTIDWKSLSFKSRTKPVNSVWMEDAKLKNLIICQPEVREPLIGICKRHLGDKNNTPNASPHLPLLAKEFGLKYLPNGSDSNELVRVLAYLDGELVNKNSWPVYLAIATL